MSDSRRHQQIGFWGVVWAVVLAQLMVPYIRAVLHRIFSVADAILAGFAAQVASQRVSSPPAPARPSDWEEFAILLAIIAIVVPLAWLITRRRRGAENNSHPSGT